LHGIGIDKGIPKSIIISMKTAISLPDDLFHAVDRIAEEEKISRSKVFVEAIEDLLRRRKNRRLLKDLNDAYAEEESPEEKDLRRGATKYYARKIRKEKW
jgi:metal-responsive CopG/Arc/MetJ family transcriptional regulator